MTGAIKVGVVGYGNSAKRFHIPFIEGVLDLKLVAILQRSAAPSDPAAASPGSHCTVDFPTVRHHRTADDFFADANIDLVVVATSNSAHGPMAKMALEAGRHGTFNKGCLTHVLPTSLINISYHRQAIHSIDRGSGRAHSTCR